MREEVCQDQGFAVFGELLDYFFSLLLIQSPVKTNKRNVIPVHEFSHKEKNLFGIVVHCKNVKPIKR